MEHKLTQKCLQIEGTLGNPASICNQMNLNVANIYDEGLLENATYRRLYNIVINDMSRSELNFRKNLIKELYFLLQITPVIKLELKEDFLNEVEKWYNLNDHKKIDLASNKLTKMLHIVNNKKDSAYSIERPKTGVSWNLNVSPFLRPYTAKKTNTAKRSNKNRPESSKNDQTSTKVETEDDYYIREFTTNIQEQLEISQDFIHKHRTSHPEYEPIYEQLYKILKKIENHPPKDDSSTKQVNAQTSKFKRYTKSAFTKYNQAKRNQQVNPILDHFKKEEGQILDFQPNQNYQFFEEKNSIRDESSESEIALNQDEEQNVKNVKKAFVIEHNKENAIKSAQKQQHSQLEKYTHLISQKIIRSSQEDKGLVRNYVNYARVKSAMKKQFNRKIESKRMLSANAIRNYPKTHHSHNKLNQNVESTTKIPEGKFIDLTNCENLLMKHDEIDPYPTYDQRQVLKKLYQKQTTAYNKFRVNQIQKSSLAANLQFPLTKNQRFCSPIRFDPFSQQNVRKHNQEAIEEIDKIRQKIGGKNIASTQNLMKALYINHEKTENVQWEARDHNFGMVSNGSKPKKLKKRGRKLDKSSAKGKTSK